MNIESVITAKDKIEICKNIIEKLPEWFDEQGRKDYAAGIEATEVWACFIEEKPIGFISIKSNNKFTSEVYVFGVLREYHRSGIGSRLMEAVYKKLKTDNVKLLVLKTLDESADYEPYEQTRNFYLKHNFIPVDVYKKIWNKENPCLLMVKIINS